MTPAELLERTKREVEKRWGLGYTLWHRWDDKSCILGCLGFAYFGKDFRAEWQDEAYDALRSDPVTAAAISALAANVDGTRVIAHGDDDLELVYRQNDSQFGTPQDAINFIDQALADLQVAVGA